MISGPSRWVRVGWVLLVLGAAGAGLYFLRRPILRAAGWALVTNDAVESADIVVVPLDAGGGGVLEAADLVESGIAARVALFVEIPDVADREFARRRVPYQDAATH